MHRSGRYIRAFLHLCILAFLTSGCATAQAKSTPGAPALDMPPPPPRVVDTTELEPSPPASLPDEPARHTPAQTPRRTPPPRSDANRQPEPPAVPPTDAPKPAAEAPKAPPTLQTTPADVEGKEEQQIRVLLGRANTDLSHVDYQRLNADARTQYDTAKRFLTQAEDALRTKNLVFARSVAEKAATLAAQLAGK